MTDQSEKEWSERSRDGRRRALRKLLPVFLGFILIAGLVVWKVLSVRARQARDAADSAAARAADWRTGDLLDQVRTKAAAIGKDEEATLNAAALIVKPAAAPDTCPIAKPTLAQARWRATYRRVDGSLDPKGVKSVLGDELLERIDVGQPHGQARPVWAEELARQEPPRFAVHLIVDIASAPIGTALDEKKVTRESLIASGVTEPAADEMINDLRDAGPSKTLKLAIFKSGFAKGRVLVYDRVKNAIICAGNFFAQSSDKVTGSGAGRLDVDLERNAVADGLAHLRAL